MNLYFTQGKEARLRRAPDPESEVMATLPAGTEIEVLKEKGRFVQVRVRDSYQANITGYLAIGFVRDYKTIPPGPEHSGVDLFPCPRCGGADLVVQAHAQGSVNHRISLDWFSYISIKSRICLDCGYVEPCLDSEDLAKLRAHHEQYKE